MADRNDFNRVDIAFVVDVTGSMGSFLSAAKANIRNMLDTFSKQRGVDIRAGLVEYQDFCDEHSSFMIRKQMLTHDLEKVHKAIANMSPGGGGDIPEAVYDGVEAAATLRWDDRSVKVAVLVGDAPPHATAAHITDPKEKASRHRAMRGDSLVDGSPSGVTLHTCTAAMEDKGITVFAIVVSGCQVTLACFEEIASFTGGQAFMAGDGSAIKQIGKALSMELDQMDLDWQIYEAMQEIGCADVREVSASTGFAEHLVATSAARLAKRGFTVGE